MKVLIVTFEFVPFSGGIARYTYEIARGMAALDCQVTVLAPTYNHCKEIDGKLLTEIAHKFGDVNISDDGEKLFLG